MKTLRASLSELVNNPVLVGMSLLLVTAVAVYISYGAENGLPFVPAYTVNVDVANAAQLVKNADVRIGGARVGQVVTITAEPPSRSWPHPYARLGLVLDEHLAPLGPRTHYEVRLSSVLGGKYLELFPGPRPHPGAGVPDGGTLTLSTDVRRSHELPSIDLDGALQAFGPRTRQGLRASVTGLGDAAAGRGAQFNDAISQLRALTGPLEDVLSVLVAPSTRLSELISGLAGTTGALVPLAPTVTALLAEGATTLNALDTPALGQALDALPGTESLGTVVLDRSEPVLAQAARMIQELKPGAALLSTASQRFDQIITAATPVFRQARPLAGRLEQALVSVDALARDPASQATFNVLGSSDLASFGASAFVGLGAILRAVAPAQFACNVTGMWVKNFASALSEGDSTGAWLRFSPVIDLQQLLQSPVPAPHLHNNPNPIEDAHQCQAGNEGYTPGQLIGNPPSTSATVGQSAPPPGVLERGAAAGLVP